MKITFVLPGYSTKPIGGFLVVYEYANRLARLGHTITVVHPRRWLPDGRPFGVARRWARAGVRSALQSQKVSSRPSWFVLDDEVASTLVASLEPVDVPRADAVIATSWETAYPISRLPANHGAKLHLIQHYETWAGPKGSVNASWRLPLHKVVISSWLVDIARELGVEGSTTIIPNGIDTDRFRIVKAIDQRSGHHVGMLYHTAPWKGTGLGLAAIEAARDRVGEVQATLFGTFKRPRGLPRWVRFVESPGGEELVDLYNSFDVFLHPSYAEGWPLPPAEAMACGCALVATANKGVTSYAIDESTALLARVGDADALARQLVRALQDSQLRERIADAGHQAAQVLSWDASVDRLVTLIESLVEGPTLAGAWPTKPA